MANNGALPPSPAEDVGCADHYAHHYNGERDHDERGYSRLVGRRVKVDAEQRAVRLVAPLHFNERLEVRRTESYAPESRRAVWDRETP